MSYKSIITSSTQKVVNHAIATKILDKMDKQRTEDNTKSKRRWVWELLQNAKDVKHEDIDVDVEIEFKEDNVTGSIDFRHNGKPFSIDNVTFLIEQVSTKDREQQEDNDTGVRPTGKFGTGFLATHLLSEIVSVHGIVKEPELPYKEFDLLLDRSGTKIEHIIASVHNSLKVLDKIEVSESVSRYDPTAFNTSFNYKLNSDGIDVANAGLSDLDNNLPYTMVFVPEIKSVRLISNNILYQISDKIIEEGENILIFTIQKITNDNITPIYIAKISKDRANIAVPVDIQDDGAITIKRMPDFLPRLFCDFPLIGSEDFYIPFIINSSSFNPDEPRSGVSLTERENEKVIENKEIISEAISLFEILLDYAAENNWKDIYNLSNIKTVTEKEWLSTGYYDENIKKPITKKLCYTNIVNTSAGRKSILDEKGDTVLWFPASSKKEIREAIWKLSNQWIPSLLPLQEDIHNWYSVLLENCGRLSLKVIANSIQSKKTTQDLQNSLANQVDVYNWLNEYFDLLNLEGKFIEEVVNNKYAVIPNQNGIFRKNNELHWDYNIDEKFKNILKTVGEDIRDQLRDLKINTQNKYSKDAEFVIKHFPKKPDDVVTRINKIISKVECQNRLIAALDLISLIPNNMDEPKRIALYGFCSKIYDIIIWDKSTIKYNDNTIWAEADKIVINDLVRTVSKCKNMEELCRTQAFTNKDALDWLNTFVGFLVDNSYDYYLNDIEYAILPNQHGNFIIKDSVFLDDDSIDEDLKDIAETLGLNLRKELLDKKIFLELGANRTYTKKIIAEKITALIIPRLSELPRTEETKQVFRQLYLWFREHKNDAPGLFLELYITRHKLYDDDEVADSMQKAEDLKQLMDDYKIVSIAQLREIISSSNFTENNISSSADTQPITKETLASLGIGSLEELEIALQDVNLAKIFLHNSVPTVEMFVYAQSLISRAKTNILNFLRLLPEYDCRNVDETAPTILSGILRNGAEVNIITRPSDNGEVIIYYPSEKDALELQESELWIDNGIDQPSLLTLGRILKITGITKIPI